MNSFPTKELFSFNHVLSWALSSSKNDLVGSLQSGSVQDTHENLTRIENDKNRN